MRLVVVLAGDPPSEPLEVSSQYFLRFLRHCALQFCTVSLMVFGYFFKHTRMPNRSFFQVLPDDVLIIILRKKSGFFSDALLWKFAPFFRIASYLLRTISFADDESNQNSVLVRKILILNPNWISAVRYSKLWKLVLRVFSAIMKAGCWSYLAEAIVHCI